MPGIDIAEIAGRHAERERSRRCAERQAGGNVINDLRRDPREVDRVDRGEVQFGAQFRVGEQRFDDVLAVVEITFDRDREGVRRLDRRRRHLPALHLGNPAVRIQHENVERGAVAAGGERRRAGIARGRADDRHLFLPPRQHFVEQPAEQLQRQILEGEGRAVKQLQ